MNFIVSLSKPLFDWIHFNRSFGLCLNIKQWAHGLLRCDMSPWKTVQVESVLKWLMRPSGKLRAFRVLCADYQLGKELSQIGRTPAFRSKLHLWKHRQSLFLYSSSLSNRKKNKQMNRPQKTKPSIKSHRIKFYGVAHLRNLKCWGCRSFYYYKALGNCSDKIKSKKADIIAG